MKEECYEFIKGPNNKVSIVGFGSYGQVKLARNTQTGEMVAIKLVHMMIVRCMEEMLNKKQMFIIN